MKTTKKLFTLLLLSAFIYSCDNSDNWSPPAPLGPDNPGAYFDFGIVSEGIRVQPDDTYFTLTLVRAENKAGTTFQLPITIVEDNPDLIIPTSVTFAAGSTTAELRIEMSTLPCDDHSLNFSIKFDDRYFDPWRANASNHFDGRVVLFRPPTHGPVTVDNVVWFVQEDDVETVSFFTNRATAATFVLTEVSPRIYEWQEEHRGYQPTFSHYAIRIRRSTAQDSFTSFYTPSGQFFWGQPVDGSGMFHPIRTAGANPSTDVTIVATRRSGSGAPYAATSGGVPINEHIGYAFREWLNKPEGFTIIRDWIDPENPIPNNNEFWFRSRANRHDWFKVVRQ